MIHRTEILIALAFLPVVVSAKTVYSGEFDYHYFKSPEQYFSGRTPAEISRMCDSGERASNDDLAQCSHLKFDRAAKEMNKKVQVARSKFKKGDGLLKSEGEPAAVPYFDRAQDAWIKYRDNECYSETYMMGEAAERYIFFWECMANITEGRIKELSELLKY
jgi:uncharacterized protein YecT (DUF1311 family)